MEMAPQHWNDTWNRNVDWLTLEEATGNRPQKVETNSMLKPSNMFSRDSGYVKTKQPDMKLWPSLIQSTREGISQRDFDSSKSPHDGHWEEILSRVEAHEMNTRIPSIDGMFLHLGDMSRLFITNKNIPQLNTMQKLHWESQIIFLLLTNTSKNTQDPCASQLFLARICHHQRRPRGNDARYRCSQLARRLPKNKASRGWNQLSLDFSCTHVRGSIFV